MEIEDHRAMLITAVAAKQEECVNAALTQSAAVSEASPPKASNIPAIERWQAELASAADKGRGIDALLRILGTIKAELADDEAGLSVAVDEMRDCAERQLEG